MYSKYLSEKLSEDMLIRKYEQKNKRHEVLGGLISTLALSGAVASLCFSGLLITANAKETKAVSNVERLEVVDFESISLSNKSVSEETSISLTAGVERILGLSYESLCKVNTEHVEDTETLKQNKDVNKLINYNYGSEYVTLESDKELVSVYDKAIKVKDNLKTGFEEPKKIRCTFYIDHGYTKSGTYTRPGVLAGKKEWLGKVCKLYAIDENGNIGEEIGTYEFLDTGAGIGGDSLKEGTSIDMWFSTYAEGESFRDMYGDYVYMEILETHG